MRTPLSRNRGAWFSKIASTSTFRNKFGNFLGDFYFSGEPTKIPDLPPLRPATSSMLLLHRIKRTSMQKGEEKSRRLFAELGAGPRQMRLVMTLDVSRPARPPIFGKSPDIKAIFLLKFDFYKRSGQIFTKIYVETRQQVARTFK